jgi:type II pantothenate kinase
MPPAPPVLGLDVGATLAKIAFRQGEIHTERLPSRDLDAVRQRIVELAPGRVVMTGGGAAALGAGLPGAAAETVSEFEAWSLGGAVLAAEEGLALPARYLLVSAGTGTSVLVVDGASAVRAGGTGLGGGTLVGLGRLLAGAASFAELSALAARGERGAVDLLVGDVYSQGAPIPPDLTAANFAKLASTEPADLAHALVGLVGENIALVCAGLARLAGTNTVVLGGSTLAENPALVEVLAKTLGLTGLDACFLRRGAYCGAVGALVAGERLAGIWGCPG